MDIELINLIGQSLMVRFEGTTMTSETRQLISQTRAGGVILFADNITTPEALHALCRDLQNHAAAEGLPPLLISIDQEGGVVSRFTEPLTTVPSQMAQAATGDPYAAYTCARINGEQLRHLGINVDFAPVLDVNCNPANPVIGTRSFGDQPDVVELFGVAALRGYQESQVIATIKHFPGHGDTEIDSHLGLPTVRHGLERLKQIELAPFAEAIRIGAPAVMTAHIVFPELDDVPATLSHTILSGLLRKELGFEGVIFTDALEMRAIADRYGPGEAAVLSKKAGADIVLPLGELKDQMAVVEALGVAVQSGRLSQDMFEATSQRVDGLRATYAITHEMSPYAGVDSTHHEQALDIARRGITVAQDRGVLPLAHEAQVALIDCTVPRFSLVEESVERAKLLQSLVHEVFPNTKAIALTPHFDEQDVAQVMSCVQESDVVILVTRNALLNEKQATLAQAITAQTPPVVHVIARNPYDTEVVPGAAATILT
ncbi:MAG: beta-N-acetylhexosaminidase, partial [Chloroflexota bacterium]